MGLQIGALGTWGWLFPASCKQDLVSNKYLAGRFCAIVQKRGYDVSQSPHLGTDTTQLLLILSCQPTRQAICGAPIRAERQVYVHVEFFVRLESRLMTAHQSGNGFRESDFRIMLCAIRPRCRPARPLYSWTRSCQATQTATSSRKKNKRRRWR
jgi:hypothetical protein